MFEYIIVGDTESYNDCLVVVCGADEDEAKKTLQKMITDPTNSDKQLIKGYSNLRLKKVESKNCWWNDSFLCN